MSPQCSAPRDCYGCIHLKVRTHQLSSGIYWCDRQDKAVGYFDHWMSPHEGVPKPADRRCWKPVLVLGAD